MGTTEDTEGGYLVPSDVCAAMERAHPRFYVLMRTITPHQSPDWVSKYTEQRREEDERRSKAARAALFQKFSLVIPIHPARRLGRPCDLFRSEADVSR